MSNSRINKTSKLNEGYYAELEEFYSHMNDDLDENPDDYMDDEETDSDEDFNLMNDEKDNNNNTTTLGKRARSSFGR
jgi:hypothetical protein